MKTDAFDQYLARCVECFLRSQPMPDWPSELQICPDEAALRVTFHGIALLLIEASPQLPGWPAPLVDAIKQEARVQSFWELSHAKLVSRLVETLHAAGIEALLLKGTALAYSHYPKPALRRRGDSDVLIESADRAKTRAVFEACGLVQCSDVRPLQECWKADSKMGFDHMIDLHWRISASSAISGLLEANTPRRKTQALPSMSPNAASIGSVDNLILICINRAQHAKFGYLIGEKRLFDNDRLIWAADIDLLTSSFAQSEWNDLVTSAAQSASSDIVLSGLRLAQSCLKTPVPGQVLKRLEQQSGDTRLTSYLSSGSGKQRLMLDLAASPTWRAKLRLIGFKLFPSKDLIHERYPDAQGWPLSVLRIRRLFAGLGKLMMGRT
ncbi:MAG: nucleotidyltransferase family protein [Pseudomonadota bacterium]